MILQDALYKADWGIKKLQFDDICLLDGLVHQLTGESKPEIETPFSMKMMLLCKNPTTYAI